MSFVELSQGLRFTRHQIAEMARAASELAPRLSQTAPPERLGQVLSVNGTGDDTCLVVRARLESGAIQTVALNPIVALALAETISKANSLRRWWKPDGRFRKTRAYGPSAIKTLTASLTSQLPPHPLSADFATAVKIVAIFTGSDDRAFVLNMRAQDGSTVAWSMNPIVLGHLFTIVVGVPAQAGWWRDDGAFNLTPPN
jgi:hypothetical protein